MLKNSEEIRYIYGTSTIVEEDELRLEKWLYKAQTVYSNAITTIHNHLDGICNYSINRTTSGVMCLCLDDASGVS